MMYLVVMIKPTATAKSMMERIPRIEKMYLKAEDWHLTARFSQINVKVEQPTFSSPRT